MTRLKALLFDVDGTLAENEEVHRGAFNQSFRDHGLDWEWSRPLYRELLAVTGGRERIRHYLESERPDFHPPALETFIATLHRHKTHLYARAVAQGRVALRPGVRRIIEAARSAGLRLAIATTTSPANVSALLRATLSPDAESWFEVIGAGNVVSHKKPAPDIYAYVLDRMGLEAGACLALEDSENGVASARAVSIPCLVTPSLYTAGQDFPGVLAVLSDLGEPDAPFQVLAGDVGDARHVDLELLHRVHGRAHASA